MVFKSRRISSDVAMLRAAKKEEWNKVYEALDSGCNVNAEYRGNTLGTIAMTQLKGYKVLDILIDDYGLDINRPIDGMYSLLGYAKNFENFDYLISKGKEAHAQLHKEDAPNGNVCAYPSGIHVYNGDFLHNPVHTAIINMFNSRAFDMLKTLGFEFNLLSPHNKNTMLFTAIKYNNMAALDKLSKYIDVNTPNMYNEVPIMWACQKGNVEAVGILINHGSDLSVVSEGYRDKDKNGLKIATKKFESNRPLIAWVRGRTEERLKIYALLHGKTNFNAATAPHMYTNYMQESYSGDLQCMKSLYEEHGANPFLADSKGKTALWWSALSNNYQKFAYNLSLFQEKARRDFEWSYLNELYSIKKHILSKRSAELFEYMRIKNIKEAYGPDTFGDLEWPPYSKFETIPETFIQNLQHIYTDVTNDIERIENERTETVKSALPHLRRQ